MSGRVKPINGEGAEKPLNFACGSSREQATIADQYRTTTLRMRALIQRLLLLPVAGLLVLSFASHAQHQQTQSPAAVHRAIEDFLRAQTSSYGNRATFTVGSIDPRLSVPACATMDVFVPPGGRLWGNSSVAVRCAAPAPWTLYVSVAVRISGTYVAAARALTAGQTLSSSDVTAVQGDLTQSAAPLVSDISDALGKTLSAPVAAGQPLRADALRIMPAILQGQTVKLVSQGPGFRVSAEGKAIANAAAGQVAQVRTATGQTVSGVVRADGSVEVNF
jgi:flagella basal body P-ring formation protein FlgA